MHNNTCPKVFIIILNWNRLKDILDCLESVYQMDYENYEVIVVDNNSEDGSLETIKERYTKAKIIKNKQNLGFAGGNNVGIQNSLENGADYVWLLNNDATCARDCLSKIVEAAEHAEQIGLVTPVVYYHEKPDKPQFAGSYIDWEKFTLLFPNGNEDLSEAFQNGPNVCLWGTALLIKRKLIEKVGLLKEEYFAYWEDTEYSLRSIRAGFRNMVCNDGRVYHKHQFDERDNSKKSAYYYYLFQRNKYFLGNEYIRGILDKLKFKIRYFAELSEYTRRCDEKASEAILRGAWHGVKGITGLESDNEDIPQIIKNIIRVLSKCHPIFIGHMLTFNLKEIKKKLLLYWKKNKPNIQCKQ